MVTTEIVNKLEQFLNEHSPLTKECQVIYVMVEFRKLLDHNNDLKLNILRFYCDWILHTNKTRNNWVIEQITQEVYNEWFDKDGKFVPSHKTKTSNFIGADHLRNELEELLRETKLPMDLIQKNNWIKFIGLLNFILADQPIILNPSMNHIKEIRFKCLNNDTVALLISFDDNITKTDKTYQRNIIKCLKYEQRILNKSFYCIKTLPLNSLEIKIALESFLIHVRNIHDFLCKPKNYNHLENDVNYTDFNFEKSKLIFPTNNSIQQIDKFLAHITRKRIEDPSPNWEVDKIKETIDKALESFFNQLGKIKE